MGPSTAKPPVHVTVKSRDVQRGSLQTAVLRIVHVSDTHNGNYGGQLPHGDVLIHSGDFTNAGDEEPGSVASFLQWFLQEPHRYKILVCGNHELLLDRRADLEEYLGCDTPEAAVRSGFQRPVLLNDSAVAIEGVHFYGSSWNHCCQAWSANDREREARWAQIPAEVDVLITHQPPLGILDLAWLSRGSRTYDCGICGPGTRHRGNYAHWGCASLLHHVRARQIPLHCFGHVHDEHGFVQQAGSEGPGRILTTYSNAAMDIYHAANVIDFEYCASTTADGGLAATTASQPVGPFWIRTESGQVVDVDADPATKLQKVWLWQKLRPAANQLWFVMPAPDSAGQLLVASAVSYPHLGSDPRCLCAVGHRVRALTRGEAAEVDGCHLLLLPETKLAAMQRGPVLLTFGHLHVALDPDSSELILQEGAAALQMELEHCALA